jgi:peptide/nickel transport system ATP-binding protein
MKLHSLVAPMTVQHSHGSGLVVDGLSVRYPSRGGKLHALQDVSLSVAPGEVLGLVGESGSGKSTVLLALLGLLEPGAVQARRLGYDGHDLLREAPRLRGRRIGMVFQDTAAALNPARTVGSQLTEPMRLHLGIDAGAAWTRATELLAETGLPRPADIMRAYPHQLSGGMKQRVGIAAALATEPDLLLLDEPTTALDVTVEAQILALLGELRVRRGLSMLLVSHNLGIVDRLCDTVSVLYAGRVAEAGPAADVLHRPRHPYTKGLLAALPRPDRPHAGRLAPIPGGLPDLLAPDPGCNFRPRCAFAAARCELPQHLAGVPSAAACHRADALTGTPWPVDETALAPPVIPARPLLEAKNLTARFDSGGLIARLLGQGRSVLAVDGVSLRIGAGEVVGLVGESGCGKSTLGRLLLRLLPSRGGSIRFGGQLVGKRPDAGFRRRAQIVFQNPDSSLNPRQTVGAILGRAVRWFRTAPDVAAEVDRLLDLVHLPRRYASRYPHQLSGGEKQRVGIARALASRPEFLVCDEAVSALDVSVQAAVLNLLRDLRDRLGVAYLFISHDIGVIAHIADRIAVMYHGTLVEEGPAAAVLHPPYHPYTELLLASVPLIGQHRAPAPRIERPAPAGGCKFAARCPRHLGPVCDTVPPPARPAGPGHSILCHIPLPVLEAVPHWLAEPETVS